MHERKAIRDAVIAQLTGAPGTWATAAGPRVTSSRMAPQRLAELPAVSVYTGEEAIDPKSAGTAPRELTRRLVLVVEGWVKASDPIDDVLDALALELETAMDADQFLGNTCGFSILDSTSMGIKVDGDRPLGCVHLEYAVTYRSDLRKAVATDKFNTAATEISLSGTQATADRAKATVTGINP